MAKAEKIPKIRVKLSPQMKLKHPEIAKKVKRGWMTASDYAKIVKGKDLRTTATKKYIEKIAKQKKQIKVTRIYKAKKTVPASIKSYSYKQYSFKSIAEYKKIIQQNKKIYRSKGFREIAEDWEDNDYEELGHSLREYISRFTYDEAKLMGQIFKGMSDREIGERLMKYATISNVKDLKYVFYADDTDVGNSDLLNNTFRLDQLKHYIDIFNFTAENTDEVQRNIGIFDKIVKKHEELYGDE